MMFRSEGLREMDGRGSGLAPRIIVGHQQREELGKGDFVSRRAYEASAASNKFRQGTPVGDHQRAACGHGLQRSKRCYLLTKRRESEESRLGEERVSPRRGGAVRGTRLATARKSRAMFLSCKAWGPSPTSTKGGSFASLRARNRTSMPFSPDNLPRNKPWDLAAIGGESSGARVAVTKCRTRCTRPGSTPQPFSRSLHERTGCDERRDRAFDSEDESMRPQD